MILSGYIKVIWLSMKHIEKVSRYEALLNNGIKLEIPKARYKFVEETFVSYKGEL